MVHNSLVYIEGNDPHINANFLRSVCVCVYVCLGHAIQLDFLRSVVARGACLMTRCEY